MTMKKLLRLAMIVFIFFVNCKCAQAQEQKTVSKYSNSNDAYEKAQEKKTMGKFSFYYKTYREGISIQKVVINKKIGKNAVLKIPSSIKGKKVIKLVSYRDDGITDDDTVLNIFGEMGYKKITGGKGFVSNIAEIKIPQTVKYISSCCFRNTGKGKTINIPRGVTENIDQFCDGKWKKVTISQKNSKYISYNNFLLSKSRKILYGYMGNDKKLVIPKSVTTIAKGAFCYGQYESIIFNKKLQKIYHFCDFATIGNIEIEKGNKHYAIKNNCLYNKKSKNVVLAIPKKKKIVIPKVVKYLTSVSEVKGLNADKIIFPKTFKAFKANWGRGFGVGKKTTVVFKSKKPPKVKTGGFWDKIVCVPKGTISDYSLAFSYYITPKKWLEWS